MLSLKRTLQHTAGLICLAAVGSAQNDLIHLQANMALGLEDSTLIQIDNPMTLGQSMIVDLDLEGLPMTLDLAPFSVRSKNFKVIEVTEQGEQVIASAPVRTLRGTVLEDPGSMVAASLMEDGLYVRISLSSGDDYWVQPIASKVHNASPNDYVLYHNSDTIDVLRRCGADLLDDNEPKAVRDDGHNTYGALLWICEVGCDTDANYFNDYGSSAAVQARIEAVINGLNVQYERDVEIRHEISHMIIRTTNGPYTSTDPGTLLDQFRQEWVSNQGGVHRDIAHLFTGKNLNGGVIGIAWLGVICNNSFGYGLAESDCCGAFSCTTDLSAHELGHNWNADHCSCNGWTMNPSITCANQFHATNTIPALESYRNGLSCLHQDADGDILFADDFESGVLGGQWNCSEILRCKIKHKAQSKFTAGVWGLQLKKTVDIDVAVSTAGYSAISVLFDERSQNYESHEFLTLLWFDGASWNQADQWQQKGWRERDVALPAGAGNNASFAMRLSCNAKGKQERSKIDNIFIIGN